MKFFVTDDDLDCWERESLDALREQQAAALALVTTQHEADLAMRDLASDRVFERLQACHDAELTRLREDRREELARLADPAGPFVAHLIAEVEWSRLQYAYERQRADVSIDQRLAERGLGPATIPPRPVTAEKANDLMAELLKNTDFAAMGSAEGVER